MTSMKKQPKTTVIEEVEKNLSGKFVLKLSNSLKIIVI